MNYQQKNHNFIAQGSILAMTGILCRLIGMLYRIPLIDVIGTRGNGYYTSAYSIYNILLVPSSYSLPTAISKVISVRLAEERYDDIRTTLRVAFLYSTLMGGLMCSLMFFGAGPIAAWMNKPFCAYALRTLAPTVWIMAYLGVLRGYFQGSGNMVPTAVSQILEQVINAVVSIVMAVLLFDYGSKANLLYAETEFSYAYGAAGGTIGTGAGALVALLFFLLMMLLYGRMPSGNGYFFREAAADEIEDVFSKGQRGAPRKPRSRAKKSAAGNSVEQYIPNRGGTIPRESAGQVAGVLLVTLLPILLSSTVYNISTVLDDFIFSRAMGAFGMAGTVVFLWGVFGEYRILFNIPVAMANSLSSSVIPSLTNAVASRNRALVVQKVKLSQHFVMLISIPAAVGLFVLAEPICDLLFSNEDNQLLVQVLRRGTPAIVLFSLSTITNGILQGLGHLSEPLRNALIALVIHVGALAGFLFIEHDIHSVIYANTVFALVVCVLNSRCMHRHVQYRLSIRKVFGVPILASAVMGGAVWLVSRMLLTLSRGEGMMGKASLAVVILLCVGLAVLVYFPMLIILRAFRKDELLEMPMGLRLYKVLHRIGMME